MTNSSEFQRQLTERVRFYRELGIYDFYRREDAESVVASAVEPQHAESLPSQEDSGQVTQATTSEEQMTPEKALRVIREDLGDCTRCVLHKQGRKQIVFGVGNPRADIMFVGEGPGADEDQQGEPFVGRAGQLLNNMITAMGIRREDVYIANVVKCRPPGNRTPEREECDTCSPFLMRQIAVVKPKIVVALGAVAAKTLLGVNDAMVNLRGRVYDFKNTKLAVTYHPAYLLRDPRQKKEAWKDLQMVMKYLGMPVPQTAPGLLFTLLLCRAAFRHLAAHAGQYFLECLLRAHFFAATLVLAVLVLEAAGAAAHFLDFVSSHHDHGMIGRALTTRAIIVYIITEPWHKRPPGRVLIARILARSHPIAASNC